MKDRILALIDPAGRLRSASSLLRSLQVHEYSSIESLLGSRRQVSSSLCIVLDADLVRLGDLDSLLERDGLPPLTLAAVSDEKEGRRWIENGAADFVVLPGRREELDCRIRAMTTAATMLAVFFQRAAWYLMRTDPNVDANWLTFNRMRMRDSKLGLLPRYRYLFGTATLSYFRPGYSPEEFGSTAQAVAYLASSPAARAAHL